MLKSRGRDSTGGGGDLQEYYSAMKSGLEPCDCGREAGKESSEVLK